MITLRNQVLIWIGLAIIGLLIIWTFRGILLPFVVGLALAYVLNPVVNLVQRARLSRAWSTAVVLLFVLVGGINTALWSWERRLYARLAGR